MDTFKTGDPTNQVATENTSDTVPKFPKKDIFDTLLSACMQEATLPWMHVGLSNSKIVHLKVFANG